MGTVIIVTELLTMSCIFRRAKPRSVGSLSNTHVDLLSLANGHFPATSPSLTTTVQSPDPRLHDHISTSATQRHQTPLMSDSLLFFEPDGFTPSPTSALTSAPNARDIPAPFTKPASDFSAPALVPGTIFYLTITTPHTDSWTYHGPVSTFAALLPLVEDAVSAHPAAKRKWKKIVRQAEERDKKDVWDHDAWDNFVLREKGSPFKERGFTTFVFAHQKAGFEVEGEYTVLSVQREINPAAYEVLPAPVFTLTSHGPMHHDMGSSLEAVHSGLPKGRTATSTICGSYASSVEAQMAARGAMEDLVRGE
ncbi:hypothetical protein K458DRAFT_469767 [Lentithecium fluviatile CBS 122367]|uniref:Uncharacterized protein n=1 Tax=Lentithecium fluviatile CBS 122367 TaxID=1168545 RepID=A0A6G1IDA9_9PLEO|nr:hypothetical protein K458DRAFT_469767 [Lentithecium fluviatile CBS 122367]